MLVAIAVPVFTSQLEKSREATDTTVTVTDTGGVITATKDVVLKQNQDGWKSTEKPAIGGVSLTDDIAKAGEFDDGTTIQSEKLPEKTNNLDGYFILYLLLLP